MKNLSNRLALISSAILSVILLSGCAGSAQAWQHHVNKNQGIYTDQVSGIGGEATFHVMFPQLKDAIANVEKFRRKNPGDEAKFGPVSSAESRVKLTRNIQPIAEGFQGVQATFRCDPGIEALLGCPIYSVTVIPRDHVYLNPNKAAQNYRKIFPGMVESILANTSLGQATGGTSGLRKVYEKASTRINGKPAGYVVYTQGRDGGPGAEPHRLHFFAYVVYDKYTVLFWGVPPIHNHRHAHSKKSPNVSDLKRLNWRQMNAFMRSFKFIGHAQ